MLKKLLLTAFVVLLLAACPLFAFAAETVTGTINGLSCYVTSVTCPSDKNDPHVALENTFVLGLDASNYYLLPNVGRNTLSRLVTQKARVTGKINKKFRSVSADKIEVQEGGKWVLAWSLDLEREAREKMMQRP